MDNIHKLSKDNKVRKIAALNDFIVKQIDSSQEIRRFMRYQTIAPLSIKSVNYADAIVNQPDLTLSLTSDNAEGEKCLFKGNFSPDMQNSEQNYIFISTYRGRYQGSNGKLFLAINIIVPDTREALKYSEDSRSIEIATRIADIIDKVMVDNEYSEWLGNIKPELVSIDIGRLSNTNNFNIHTLIFEVDLLVSRSFS